MRIDEVLSGMRDPITVKRMYGEPYERDGIAVIPAAAVSAGPQAPNAPFRERFGNWRVMLDQFAARANSDG